MLALTLRLEGHDVTEAANATVQAISSGVYITIDGGLAAAH